jgi:hypothetical protein
VEKRSEKMRKEKLFGIIALVIFSITVLGIPHGYAKTPGPVLAPSWPNTWIRAVSNPTGGCTDLGLQAVHGTVVVARSGIVVTLQGATPNTNYNVLMGYTRNTAGCDDTWQSLGSINTDASGNGSSNKVLTLQSGHQYVFELKDGSGNVAFATPTLTTSTTE